MKFLQANRIAPDGRHIWGYAVCLCPIKGTPGLNELSLINLKEQHKTVSQTKFTHWASDILPMAHNVWKHFVSRPDAQYLQDLNFCVTFYFVATSWENQQSAYAKTKTQISFAVTAKLISAFVFATQTVQFLFFLNPKFQASSLLL